MASVNVSVARLSNRYPSLPYEAKLNTTALTAKNAKPLAFLTMAEDLNKKRLTILAANANVVATINHFALLYSTIRTRLKKSFLLENANVLTGPIL